MQLLRLRLRLLLHRGSIPLATCHLPTHPARYPTLLYVPRAQELERGEGDVLECDALASCLYVNEPKVKVDLTKYNERHTFRQAKPAMLPTAGFTCTCRSLLCPPRLASPCTVLRWPANAARRAGDGGALSESALALAGSV